MKLMLFSTHRRRKPTKGFTLIEVLIVLGIAGIILTLVIQHMNQASAKRVVQVEIENVTQLASGVKNLFGATGVANYTGLTNAVVLNSNAVPPNMANTPNIAHSWSPAGVTLGTAGGNSQYTITYAAVPQQFCTDLAASTYAMFTTTTVNGVAVTTVAAVSGARNVAANTLVWTGS